MLFFDIETIPNEQALKSAQWAKYKERKECEDQDASFSPAFAQVLCICYSGKNNNEPRGCAGKEKQVLKDFLELVECDAVLCGHNIKGFDIPFVCNRALAHGLTLPSPLRLAGKKPWEVQHVDTMELLKHGGKEHISLDNACLMLDIPTPKGEGIDGSQVWQAYKDGRLKAIMEYCKRDVVATRALYYKLQALGAI